MSRNEFIHFHLSLCRSNLKIVNEVEATAISFADLP